MKKTFTRDEFKKLTTEAVTALSTDPKVTEGGSTMMLAIMLTGAMVASEIEKRIFDDNTTELEIVKDKEE